MELRQTIYVGNDWRSGDPDVHRRVEVKLIDGDDVISQVAFGPGEPEDMELFRDLSGAYEIQDMAEKLYELGKQGVEVTFTSIEEDNN